jgi:hypothetical protein
MCHQAQLRNGTFLKKKKPLKLRPELETLFTYLFTFGAGD